MQRRTQAPALAVEALDDRIVPAVIDLTHRGASAEVGGALVRQVTDFGHWWCDDTRSFVRLRDNGTEQGYNTNARPLQFDELPSHSATHAITLGQVPRRTVNGAHYREFFLDVKQDFFRPKLSVDKIQVFLGNSGNLKGYSNGKLAGLSPVYDLDSRGDVSLLVTDRHSWGWNADDMVLLVPESAFAGATAKTFVYLYSKMGGLNGAQANGGFEEWGIRKDGGGGPIVPPPPPPTNELSSLSGRVYMEMDGLPGQSIDDLGVDVGTDGAPVTLTLARLESGTYRDVATAIVDVDGFYSFANLGPGTYRITQAQPLGFISVETEVGNLGGTAGFDGTSDFIDGIAVGAGKVGTEYNFEEFFVGI